jgi:hypothetical protein
MILNSLIKLKDWSLMFLSHNNIPSKDKKLSATGSVIVIVIVFVFTVVVLLVCCL